MTAGPTTPGFADIDAEARALARRVDQQARALARARHRLRQFDDSSPPHATGATPASINEEIQTMPDTLDDAVAASRRRIAASMAAFDQTTLSAPVVARSDGDSPECLLDNLCRSAVATAAADLAMFAGATPPGVVLPALPPVAARSLLPAPRPDSDTP